MIARTLIGVVPGGLLGTAVPSPARGAQVPSPGTWAVRTVDDPTGNPLDGALVSYPEHGTTRLTDGRGLAEGQGPGGSGSRVRVMITRLGYAVMDTLVAVPAAGVVVELRLARSAIALPALTVEAERRMTSRELHSVMFDREIAVGAVGVTQAEIKAVPPLLEADLVRSLQAFAGVSSVNDYSGELFVRGGGSDQVAVLLEGAPVFAPYHLFGYFGAFNTDAIESVEFYRGSIPARYGGALSGVVSARQVTGADDGTRLSGGISLLGLRIAASGAVPWGGVRWLAATRRASVNVARIDFPYAFHDLNLGVEAHPAERHRVRVSLFASNDDFTWDGGQQTRSSAVSEWANLASSATWSWVRDHRLASEVTAYYSRYDASRTVGGLDPSYPVTTNLISAAGLRVGVTFRGERVGARAGVAVEGGPDKLWTRGRGGYVDGDLSASYLHASAFSEFEGWLGPFRLAPGVRFGSERRSGRAFFEPRFSVRFKAAAFAVSASVDRTYQFMSVLRDAYALEPGAPMWFLHGPGQPVSAADGASVSVDAWRGEDWTATAAAWTRRFRNAPHWRPLLSRDPSAVEFHDGNARGLEVMVQRHSGRMRGWLSYQWARTTFADVEDAEYAPQWDRRHEVEAMVAADVRGGLEVSARTTLGAGGPFWYPAGHYGVLRWNPAEQPGTKRGSLLQETDALVVWSDVQGRLPVYARVDVSARYAFRWGSWDIVPYLSVINATNRKNVLVYEFAGLENLNPTGVDGDLTFVLEPGRQLPLFPSIGIDFRF